MQSMMEEELRKSEILQMSWILHILIITELYSVKPAQKRENSRRNSAARGPQTYRQVR